MPKLITTLAEINAIAEPTTAWFVLDNGDFKLTPASSNPSHNDPIVSHTTLRAIHSNLPDAIVALIAWHYSVGANRSGVAFAYHDDVMTTMDVLRGKTVTLVDTDGNTRLLRNITDIRTFSSLAQHLWVKATVIRNHTFMVNSCPVDFAISHDTKDIAVKQEHLEMGYPGALYRWTLGQDIGIETADLMLHAFLNTAAPGVAVQSDTVKEITFD